MLFGVERGLFQKAIISNRDRAADGAARSNPSRDFGALVLSDWSAPRQLIRIYEPLVLNCYYGPREPALKDLRVSCLSHIDGRLLQPPLLTVSEPVWKTAFLFASAANYLRSDPPPPRATFEGRAEASGRLPTIPWHNPLSGSVR